MNKLTMLTLIVPRENGDSWQAFLAEAGLPSMFSFPCLGTAGKTLRENHLTPLRDVVDISARFICNKISFQFKHEEIIKLKTALADLVRTERKELG